MYFSSSWTSLVMNTAV